MKDLAVTQSQSLALAGCYRSRELVLPEDMSFAEWEKLGVALQAMADYSIWWLGDWLAYGEVNYSQTYTQAADIAGCAPETARLAKWVAEQVPVVRRRTDLSYEHHNAVASNCLAYRIREQRLINFRASRRCNGLNWVRLYPTLTSSYKQIPKRR